MKLRVTNIGTRDIVLSGPVGVLSTKTARTVDVTTSDVEALSAQLVQLSSSNSITFQVYNDPGSSSSDLDTQFVTAADIQSTVDASVSDIVADISTLQSDLSALTAATRMVHEPTLSPSRATASPGSGPQPLANGTLMLLTFTPNNSAHRAYRGFKIPYSFTGDASFHIHWTKSSNTAETGRHVRWRIAYSVYDGHDDDVANTVETSAEVEDTYDANDTTNRVVYRTTDVLAVGFTAGHYVSIYIEAISPSGGSALNANPGLLSLDLMYRATINEGD